jgi:lipopolysaccharide/colanic/teichoic acid biosynthesis glycosyltransferase
VFNGAAYDWWNYSIFASSRREATEGPLAETASLDGGFHAERANKGKNMLKRLFDVVVASLALLVLAPLFALVAILIKLDSRGPVFYRGVRVGRFGRPFRIYKFRTMVADAEKLGPSSTAADDPRITRVGRWLRRFNLDELPQFINVLKGEMSIVGPRPQVPWAVELYPEEERKLVLSVRPGITDWATLWIRDEGALLKGSRDPDRDYLEKIDPIKRRLQIVYVQNRSLWMDLQIMVLTLKVHLFDRLFPSVGFRWLPKWVEEVANGVRDLQTWDR